MERSEIERSEIKVGGLSPPKTRQGNHLTLPVNNHHQKGGNRFREEPTSGWPSWRCVLACKLSRFSFGSIMLPS